MSNENDKLEAYRAHGVNLRVIKGEGVGDCPFCGKEKHFGVSPKTGQYRCLVACCGEQSTGNTFSFLQKIHTDALKRTKKADWERLSSIRNGMPWQTFQDADLAWHRPTGRWLLPLHNAKGSLANLLIFDPKMKPKPKLIGTTGCAQHLYLANKIKPTGPIYICEGQWDAMSLRWLMSKNNIDESITSVVSVPGANTFKKEWVELFKKRDVYLLFDNDTAGNGGMDLVVKLLLGTVASIKRIQWPSDLPDGYDLRDFVAHKAAKPKEAWKQLQTLVPDKKLTNEKAKPKLIRNTFQSVVKDFRKVIHTDKSWEDALAVTMAVTISASLKNDPLWVFIVGPPGSGKTLLIDTFRNIGDDKAAYLSKITRPALVSGFRGEEDYSILGKLNAKCLFVKDFTTVLAMPLAVQLEIFGLLRDAYDGSCTVPFGNMLPKVYENLYFSQIAGVTDVIRKVQMGDLGERYLKLELLDESHDPREHIRAALSAIEDNIAEKAENEERLRDSVATFMNRPFNEKKLPKIPEWLTDCLINLAQLGAYLRAVVDKKGDALTYRPRPEVGTRLGKCLAKLARCLCWVFDKKKIDTEIYSLVQKIGLDTVLSWDLEILHILYNHPEGYALSDIGAEMQLSHTGISNRLNNIQHLGMVHRSADTKKDGRGNKQFIWYMSDNIRELWKGSRMEYNPPPIVRFKKRGGYNPPNRNRVKASKPKTKVRRRTHAA